MSELATMVRRVFDDTLPRTTIQQTVTEATVATTKQASIPMDDPDLTDKEAMFQSLRQIIEKQDLLAARLDGISTFNETDAFNAVESYRLDADGTNDTTFSFRKGGFDGPLKTYNPRGFIVDIASNAVWGMQFIWPIKAEYLITHLSDDYSQTVIGRNKRDYVWIMARSPQVPEADYQRIVAELAAQGYDVTKLRKVPQRWWEKRP